MRPSLLVSAYMVAAVTADWTTTLYDAIVVGAGPAGIIGRLPLAFCR